MSEDKPEALPERPRFHAALDGLIALQGEMDASREENRRLVLALVEEMTDDEYDAFRTHIADFIVGLIRTRQ